MNTILEMSEVQPWGGILRGWLVRSQLTASEILAQLRQDIEGGDILVIEVGDLAEDTNDEQDSAATWQQRFANA